MELFQTPSRDFFDLPNTVKTLHYTTRQIQFDSFPSLDLTFPAVGLVAGGWVGSQIIETYATSVKLGLGLG